LGERSGKTIWQRNDEEGRDAAIRKTKNPFAATRLRRDFHINDKTHREELELVQESLAESKPAHFSPFFTFFQLRSTGYAPSKTQKLTKNQPVFANGRES